MLRLQMAEGLETKLSDHETELTKLFYSLDAVGPEIQRISGELKQFQTQSEEAFKRALDNAIAAAQEKLNKAVAAAEETTRNQVLAEIRRRYLKEIQKC